MINGSLTAILTVVLLAAHSEARHFEQVECVSEAIDILTEDEPEHRMQRLPHARRVLASRFVESSYRTGVPVNLLVSVAHFGGWFGAVEGAEEVEITATRLRYGISVCGGAVESVALYVSGECLVRPGRISDEVVKRMRLWGHLNRFTERRGRALRGR